MWVRKNLDAVRAISCDRGQEANIARVSVVARNGQLHETSAAHLCRVNVLLGGRVPNDQRYAY